MSKLAADKIAADPRIAEAKKLILDTIAEHTHSLEDVAAPDADLSKQFAKLLEECNQMRGGDLYFPYVSSGAGNGPFVELIDGSVKLDLIAGIGVHGFGHCHPALIEAGIDAAISDTVMQGNLQTNSPSIQLSRLLLTLLNQTNRAKYEHCFLSTSGAMANENALKIAFQKNHPANRILAFRHCFAGRTLALAQVTDKAAYRDGLPDTIDVDFVPFYDASNHDKSIRSAVAHLRAHLNRFPNKHAAFWMELIQGEGGYYPGHREFFLALINELRDSNCAIVADEVQTFGRTTQPYATQYFELEDQVDIITIGKLTQVCATLFKGEYNPRPGLVSQTFTGSTWAINAAIAILNGMVERGSFGEDGLNAKLHTHFAERLQALSEKYPQAISGPFGIGGMVAFTPFDGSGEKAKEMCHGLFNAGLMGFIAGSNPCRIRFLTPPGVATIEHIDLACDLIEKVILDMQASN